MHDEKRRGAMDRRGFLRAGAAGGAALIVRPGFAAARVDREAAAQAGKAAPASGGPFDLEEVSIADLQQRMQSGQETARSLVEKYTARISAMDKAGALPLRSVLEINPDAL